MMMSDDEYLWRWITQWILFPTPLNIPCPAKNLKLQGQLPKSVQRLGTKLYVKVDMLCYADTMDTQKESHPKIP